jgi:oxysterol-binding protein-related protein 9/10/11
MHAGLQIEYKGKGYFSGKSHTFKATLKPPTSSDNTQIVEGTWHTNSKTANGVTFHDVTPPKEEVTVKPIDEQGEWESRRLWNAVAKGIREGDFESASREKSRIEVRFNLT